MSEQLTRMEIRSKILQLYHKKMQLSKEMDNLNGQMVSLIVSDIKISDECHVYVEEERAVKSKKASSKKQRIDILGKISYIENFQDEDTKEFFPVKRSSYLLVNGELPIESLKKYSPFNTRYKSHFPPEYKKVIL